MVEKPVLNNKGIVTGQREIRPVWNNAQRVNHQNKLNHPHSKRNFIPTAVATKSGQVPVNANKQRSPRAAASISTVRPVDTVAPKPKVNDALPTSYSYFQAHSPVKKPINKRTAVTDINFNKKINTAKVNNVTTAGPKAVVSAAKGNGENVVKSSPCCIWRPTGNIIDHISKDSGSYMHKRLDLSLIYKADLNQLIGLGDPQEKQFSYFLTVQDPLGKFDGKADEGFLVGYFINSKAFRVFNTRTRKYLLTNSMNYEPVTIGNQTNGNAADDAGKKTTEDQTNDGERNGQEKEGGASNKEGDQNVQDLRAELDKLLVQQKELCKQHETECSTVHALEQKQTIEQNQDRYSRVIVVIEQGKTVLQVYTQEEGIDYDEVLLLCIVEDIIFGSTKNVFSVEFEQMMHKRFQMSSIEELTFFLGLYVKQKDDGIFISQDKYVANILKKFDFSSVKTASTPIENNKALLKDEEAEDVDVHLYRSMIRSLMYLTASRPDIMFAVYACRRFQVTPKVSNLHAVKRIFRYLKSEIPQPRGAMDPKSNADSGF
ncbi:retrovirus-related pol polyprotein from transposon TNT 1-94 [Tanacetum coccineum]